MTLKGFNKGTCQSKETKNRATPKGGGSKRRKSGRDRTGAQRRRQEDRLENKLRGVNTAED